MPEYLAPGVYVEEVDSGSKSVEGASTSTAGFLGQTERGPLKPQLVTNYGDFTRVYGGQIDDSYLAHTVQGFFNNGGTRCFIARVTPEEPHEIAKATLTDEDGDDVLTATAIGPGDWGETVSVTVRDAPMSSDDNTIFNMVVRYWSVEPGDVENPGSDDPDPAPEEEERFDDLTAEEGSSQYYGTILEGSSTLIEIESVGDGRPENGTVWLDLDNGGGVSTDGGDEAEDVEDDAEADEDDEASTDGGTDGVTLADYQGNDSPENRSGLAAFEEIDNISIVCAPDENDVPGVTDALVTHCENMGERFAILQAPQNAGAISDMETPVDSSYAAYYYPWIEIIDPATGTTELVPPGGHLAGIYARSDNQTGVHKAPANEVVRGAQGLQVNITKAEQDLLNPKGVNCIREFQGRGIRVWGARTTASDPSWKYINVRRLFLFLKQSIDDGTQWVVFEPNDQDLWARVRQTVEQFLTTVWRDGALMGTTPEEAFYVRCDESTMTQDDIDNGRLIVEIGVAPVKPAEFVIFRIGQWTGDS